MEHASNLLFILFHYFRFLLLGGSIYAFMENPDIDNVDVLDTTTDTWTSADPLPLARSSSSCAIYELNGGSKNEYIMDPHDFI